MVSEKQQHCDSVRYVRGERGERMRWGPCFITKKKRINQTNVKLIFNYLVGSIFLLHNNHEKVSTITK